MKNKFLISTLLLLTATITTANLVVVECTFPCLEDNNDVCEVSNYFVKCKQRTNKTKWVLKNTISLPDYQGTLVELRQSCITAPQPKLKDASHLSTNTSESTMEWPPQVSTATYDSYYSNCATSLYCDKANICVKQLAHGEVCESDNQCFEGICNQSTCQQDDSRKGSTGPSGLNTIHTILTVVGVVLFVGLVFGIYMIRRAKLRKSQKMNSNNDHDTDKEQQQLSNIHSTTATKNKTTSRSNSSSSTSTNVTTTTLSSHNSVNHNVTNILHPDYESTFITTPPPLPVNTNNINNIQSQQEASSSTTASTHNHTPSMQQQELQFQLQRQLLYNDKLDAQQQIHPPPPPYSP